MHTKNIPVILSIVFALFLSACDPSLIEGVMTGKPASPSLTNEEVIAGLKEALKVGANNAVSFTSKTDGFWKNSLIKIPFPPEAIKVRNTAINLGLGNKVEQFESNMNHAAEKAAMEAAPIFVNAIMNMSIQDGFNILKGDSSAATLFLRTNTNAALISKFSPIVQKAIDEVQLTSFYEPLATAYNTSTILTGGQAVNPDLKGYITGKALDGLFFYVAQEEKKIRRDPKARVSDILRKVFGSLDGK